MSRKESAVASVQVRGERFTLLYRWHNLSLHALSKKLGVRLKSLGEWQENGRFLWSGELARLAESFGCNPSWLRGECSEELKVAYKTLRAFWLNRSAGFDALADKLLKIDPPGSPENFAEARRRWGLVEQP